MLRFIVESREDQLNSLNDYRLWQAKTRNLEREMDNPVLNY